MLRVIKVYGSLAKFLGAKSFKAVVQTPLEAVRFLRANFPGLDAHMAEHDYKISVGRHELEAGANPEQLTLPSAKSEPIRIIPVVSGAGSGTAKILAGVALIAFAIIAGPAAGGFLGLGAGGAPGTALLGGVAAQVIGGIGLSLALGGVAQLLTPTPQQAAVPTGIDNPSDPRSSYSFGGVVNVSRQGIPVPIVYGETVVGSVVLSAGINTEQLTA
jgi:predicted phage tail protein